ncbi:carboxylate--amine ligase [Ferviditalea candida]|uniref:ATP-grasp domain-containing protein n=1 Tax=Ferviditalea candida TaxID=3108399 RepID=A0ABU5ZH38_9BACL|nr:ATP-grasp domain-containing protein [Paenibacillaceae bacterium T2]
MPRVLCTNGLLSKSLAVVRSLGSRGVEVIAADKTRVHPSGFSKYCKKTLTYPDPAKKPDAFWDWLKTVLVREKFDVLFLMDEDTMSAAVKHKAELESLCLVALPSDEHYSVCADKGQLMKLAELAQVPYPKTFFPDPSEPIRDQLEILLKQLRFPLVIKPRHSSGGRGVRFAGTEQELESKYEEICKQYPNPIIQEFIPAGPKFDISLCYNGEHECIASFAQKHLRNYPIDRGPSTVYESVYEPRLIEYAQRLMKHLPWHGVIDAEFMIDPRSGEPKLLEINPRFCNALHLSIRCGVDFPWILCQSLLGNEVEPIDHYPTGKRGRTLFPGDVLHFLSNPKRLQMDPPLWTTKLLDDMLSWNDPKPIIGFFLAALRYSISPDAWKFLISR